MFLIVKSLMLVLMILMVLILVLNLCSMKTFYDKEKNSPFECGFDPKSNSRTPFSLQFFLIAIIFLIFDVEIALLLPIIKTYNMDNITLIITSNFFIIILLLGLIHEWNQGALNWLK
uniref:NADH-ubiquinone oxidoreductase chain 3 n=1 Tax=Callispa bowringii TaxID=2558238 RepID=A0A482JMC7_9CUCU|nr:NADH dehydrogenase subunit 3 [Callispa bowringii]QBP33863.1 NADH dehydrogenase subunit 3 [Callispa bowringii]